MRNSVCEPGQQPSGKNQVKALGAAILVVNMGRRQSLQKIHTKLVKLY